MSGSSRSHKEEKAAGERLMPSQQGGGRSEGSGGPTAMKEALKAAREANQANFAHGSQIQTGANTALTHAPTAGAMDAADTVYKAIGRANDKSWKAGQKEIYKPGGAYDKANPPPKRKKK